MTLPPENSPFGSTSLSEEPLFGEPTTTGDVYGATSATAVEPLSTDGAAGSAQSTSDEAKNKAADVKDSAVGAAAGVKDTAVGHASDLKDTAAGHASDLKDTAAGHASDVKDSAVDAGTHVASVAKEQAANVASEAGQHARSLVAQGRTELTTAVSSQQGRIAEAIHGVAQNIRSMGEGKAGPVEKLSQQAGQRADTVATYFEDRSPAELVSDLSAFASRRPGVFIALAATTGLLTGRVARGLRDEAAPEPTPEPSETAAAPLTGGYAGATHTGSSYTDPTQSDSAAYTGRHDVDSVGTVSSGYDTGSYSSGSYTSSTDPLAFESGDNR